jgi:hypothetical protein
VELTWWVAAILGCVGLAICIAAALLQPMDRERRRLRLLANVGRLTRLPEYRRAARLRTLSAVVALILLVLAFGAAVVAAARPTGLPSAAHQSNDARPEDIMLCIGGPSTDPAVGATLRYFADRVKTFGTQRIGLSTDNRRVVPLTRDYQYAAAQFSKYAAASEPSGDALMWAPAVSYADYAGGVEDVLAMCLTGFPSFDQKTAQRRSLIYVGPKSRRAPGETRPVLFTTDAVRDLAEAADVQINIVSAGAASGALDALARDTGGQSFSGDSGVAGDLSEIGDHPPRPTATADDAAVLKSVETPDIPLLLALAALTGLVLWPLVVRR